MFYVIIDKERFVLNTFVIHYKEHLYNIYIYIYMRYFIMQIN